MSREKRLRRRPEGWLSKKLIGSRTTRCSRLSCSCREALSPPITWLQFCIHTHWSACLAVLMEHLQVACRSAGMTGSRCVYESTMSGISTRWDAKVAVRTQALTHMTWPMLEMLAGLPKTISACLPVVYSGGCSIGMHVLSLPWRPQMPSA